MTTLTHRLLIARYELTAPKPMDRAQRNAELREHLKKLAEWTDYADQPGRVDLLCEIVFHVPEMLTRLSENDEEIGRLQAEREALREALEQLLDDMGETGHCVCEEAKQQAIAALATPAESKEPT